MRIEDTPDDLREVIAVLEGSEEIKPRQALRENGIIDIDRVKAGFMRDALTMSKSFGSYWQARWIEEARQKRNRSIPPEMFHKRALKTRELLLAWVELWFEKFNKNTRLFMARNPEIDRILRDGFDNLHRNISRQTAIFWSGKEDEPSVGIDVPDFDPTLASEVDASRLFVKLVTHDKGIDLQRCDRCNKFYVSKTKRLQNKRFCDRSCAQAHPRRGDEESQATKLKRAKAALRSISNREDLTLTKRTLHEKTGLSLHWLTRQFNIGTLSQKKGRN